jgi:hypothetical protein
MRNSGFLVVVGCSLAALLAVPAAAQTVRAGIDVWTTPNDGSLVLDFSDNPLPAGFFCTASPAFAERIPLRGVPIQTNPAHVLGSTDTIVARLSNVDLRNGEASTPIRALAISFANRAPISVPRCIDEFNVRILAGKTMPLGTMTIRGSADGGTFDSSLSVTGTVIFSKTSQIKPFQTITETVTLQATGTPWSDSVGTGGIEFPQPVTIDTDGNGIPETSTPGTTPGFAPGWWGNPPIPVPLPHTPHEVWPLPPPPPPPPCPSEVVSAIEAYEAEANGTVSTVGSSLEVESSWKSGDLNLTIVNDADVTPCTTTTSFGTHLVSGE